MFAVADDFADVLERNADTASAMVGTLDDVCNTDKASEYSLQGIICSKPCHDVTTECHLPVTVWKL